MKGLMIFFTLALVASSSASKSDVALKEFEKDFVDDALALKACLEKVLPAFQQSIDKLMGTVQNVIELIEVNKVKVENCLSIGGSDPSWVDQLHQATCMINVIGDMVKDIASIAVNIEGTVVEMIQFGTQLVECF